MTETDIALHVHDELITTARQFTLAPGDLLIETLDEAELAADLRGRLKALVTRIENARTEAKAPHLAAGRTVDAYFKPASDHLEAETRRLSAALLTYQAVAKKRQAEAEAAARVEAERVRREALELMKDRDDEAAQDTADMLLARAAQIQEVAPAAKVDGFGSRSHWKVRVVNMELFLREAEFEWKLPDFTAMNAAARAARGKLAIPGCEVFDDRVATS